MTEHYINMRLKVPQFLHAQLVKKQAERLRRGLDPLGSADIAIVMLTEACIQEHWQYLRTEEKESTNTWVQQTHKPQDGEEDSSHLAQSVDAR